MALRSLRLVSGLVAFGLVFLLSNVSRADTFDLTTAGSSATINNAIYQQGDIQPAGTGVFDPFLRLQSHGSQNTLESGFNTDARPAPLDDKSDIHTHSLLLSNLGTTTINGVSYRQFSLDINEPQNGTNALLSLDKLQIYLASSGNIATLSDLQNSGTKIFDQGNNTVTLNAALSHGSGQSDLFVDIPNALFTGNNAYVYLYSQFGVSSNSLSPQVNNGTGANGGFEEWAGKEPDANTVPEPSTVLLAGMGLFGCAAPWVVRRTRAIFAA